ncbi:unnamed protein product [Thlaspi arvense]|uniref:Probable ubiquitin-like-specific protease 2A/B PH domain-containing protein n=1 Tax=Thlaspi arvense TaxID=13288 RepID=A0AAU9T2V9_THLAR|nr:unnamed protein product [Thlaspi arvense]
MKDSENSQVLIFPDVIVYGDIYCTNSKLTFSRDCMNVESSSVNATTETFGCQWTIEDIIRIESQWCSEVETAFVNVLLKSRDPKAVDGAKEISEVETIKLLNSRYKDIWFDTITESEESACSGHNLGTSLTNLADSFEDLVYPQGDPDAVVVRKQDIELLKPRRTLRVEFHQRSGADSTFSILANLDKGSPSTFGGREAYQRVQKWTKNFSLESNYHLSSSYLREEWQARQGKTTIDFSRASNLQLISLELTKNWFPPKEASLKRGYILELLYNLHRGHDPSILPANAKSKPPHCEVSNRNDQENESGNVNEICSWRKPSDSSSSTAPQTKACPSASDMQDLILCEESFNAGGYEPKSSKRQKVFMSPIVEEVQESGGKETPLPMDTEEETFGQEIETLRKEECLLYIEDSEDDETVSVEYVSDSQDSCEVEMKEEDDDELLLVTGESKEIPRTVEIKSDSASIEEGVNKSRDSAAASCYDLLVLSDDEGSSASGDDLRDKGIFLIKSSNVKAKRPKT